MKGFVGDVLSDGISWLNEHLLSTLSGVLKVEDLMASKGTVITPDFVERVYQYVYTFAAALVVLKFLYKGFTIYILWRDGDADSSPQDMLIGAIQAAVVMVAFPFLYNYMANITQEFADGLMAFLGFSIDNGVGLEALVESVLVSIVEGVVMLIYLILFAVMYIKLIQRGFELLILRLGVPFACIGMIDSDYGVWKSYIQVFFKTLFTSVIQIFLLSMSMLLVSVGHIIIGIAVIGAAFSAPNIMQQFMVPSGRGGGIGSKIYTTSMAVRAIRGIAGG